MQPEPAPNYRPAAQPMASQLQPQAAAPRPREGLSGMESRMPEVPRPPVFPPGRAHAAREERVPMTRLRKTIALRLKEAQNTAAMLTTFNEADMSAGMQLRTVHKDAFEKRYGVRLGFMDFFGKGSVLALKDRPSVNAEIQCA